MWRSPAIRPLTDRFGLVDRRRKANLVRRLIHGLGIMVADVEAPIARLSGGNQQRAVLAKWLATEPKLLILDCPTVGVDVSASEVIYELIREVAGRGIGVLIISSEVEEVWSMCHPRARHDGRPSGAGRWSRAMALCRLPNWRRPSMAEPSRERSAVRRLAAGIVLLGGASALWGAGLCVALTTGSTCCRRRASPRCSPLGLLVVLMGRRTRHFLYRRRLDLAVPAGRGPWRGRISAGSAPSWCRPSSVCCSALSTGSSPPGCARRRSSPPLPCSTSTAAFSPSSRAARCSTTSPSSSPPPLSAALAAIR